MVKPKNVEELMEPKTWKIPPVKIKSDDCAIYIGQVIEGTEITNPGTPIYVHKGEWVELFPTQAIAEIMALSEIRNLGAQGDGALKKLCQEMSQRIVAWNWTDNAGEPMPQPHNNPEVFERLGNDEFLWLFGASTGSETKEEKFVADFFMTTEIMRQLLDDLLNQLAK